MQNRVMQACLLMIATLAGAPAHARVDDPATLCRTRSAAVLEALRDGRYADATRHFDARMSAALPASKLAEVWGTMLPAKAGGFVSGGSPSVTQAGGMPVVQTPLHFAQGALMMRVACQADGSIGGLFFAPLPAEADAAPAAAPSHGIREVAVDVPSPPGKLPGVLTLPAGEGPFPAAVLVAGSGPNDMDETIGPNKPLRDIALGLAEAGIATLRYDKRTHAYGPQLAGQPITIDQEVTDDALAALHQLRTLPRVDPSRIFVVGHSLGALMAPRIARRDGHLAGAVLLAAPERMNLELVIHQMRYIESLGGAYAAAGKQIPAAEAARDAMAKADSGHPPKGLYFHAPAAYWLSLRDYDAIDTARALHVPLLVLQGLADYQVGPDFARWQQAFRGSHRVSLRGYPGLSHLFMPAGTPPSPADYGKAGHVEPGVIRDIAAWMLARHAVR
ncbi:alpha/beta fold hydrolase [Dyella lutea]|uniref:Alpha/beta fold hydrolase n=1 Tax=Dyella lutea TaxID=2950441 RepID=A0ABT1FAH7_9GAMM|nr:alpha/beta fold hydrolase [Dyella lutea]